MVLWTNLCVGVVHGEIGDDDRHGEGNCEYTSQGTEGTDKHPDVRLGGHVSVAHSGHGHQGPPQAQRDAVEVVVRIRLDPFSVIN